MDKVLALLRRLPLLLKTKTALVGLIGVVGSIFFMVTGHVDPMNLSMLLGSLGLTFARDALVKLEIQLQSLQADKDKSDKESEVKK